MIVGCAEIGDVVGVNIDVPDTGVVRGVVKSLRRVVVLTGVTPRIMDCMALFCSSAAVYSLNSNRDARTRAESCNRTKIAKI